MFKDTNNYSLGETKAVAKRTYNLKELGKSHIHKAIRSFIEKPDENKIIGSYFIQDKTLTYRESAYGVDYRVELIAIYTNGNLIGNSTAARIQETTNNVTVGQQTLISLGVPMVPFKVFKDAGLNIQEFKLVEQGPEETIKRAERNPKYRAWLNSNRKSKEPAETILVDVHFVGASLFEVGGKYFLFDIDRVEIQHGLFNAFMTEIPKPCRTIGEAYESLIPDEVKQAMKKGLDVKRQGEWFLIPVKGSFKADLTPKEDRQWLPKYRPMTLRAGPNRPNKSEFGVESKMLVKGKFSHSGREHKTIVLKTWHKAVPNTAIGSFTIEGDVD